MFQFFRNTALMLVLFHSIAYAQTAKITGTVTLTDSEPIPVMLLSDSNQVVKTEITSEKGSFTFDSVSPGNYKISVDDPRYEPFESALIEFTASQNYTVPPITLKPLSATSLAEVTVQKRKPVVENKIDRTVVNVDQLISTAGGDAMDVLEKSPGIVVDQNGTITFKGRSGVAIFIDDKPTYLSGAELEAYLKSLPASTLNQIELMTNPPAKYDAAGSAGVINIITKKSKSRGFNGNLTSRFVQGRKFQTRQGVNLNYMNDKIRMFGSLGYGDHRFWNHLYINRRFKDTDGNLTSIFDQDSDLNIHTQSGNIRIGADYYASEKTTIGTQINGILRKATRNSDVNSILRNPFHEIDSTIVADNGQKFRFANGGINLNFRREISENSKITADADYLKYDNQTDQVFRNFIYQPDGAMSSSDKSTGNLPSEIDIISLKTDYSHQLKAGTIEAGYKVSFSRTDNIADYRDIVDGQAVPNFDRSNHFRYNETINAAYLNFNTSYKRFTFQTGLRVENTVSEGNQLGNEMNEGSKFKRDYINLFPTVFVQYRLDSIGNNQLVTSYGKRITRPYYEDLNPFISPLDKFTYYEGNPYLNPSLTHSIELSYRFKGYFSATTSYSFSEDQINETIEINDGIYFSRPGNIGQSRFYSLNINADIPFAKWWTTNLYSEVTHARYHSQLYTEGLHTSGTFFYGSMLNNIKFGKDWAAELSGYYQSDVEAAQLTLGARGAVGIGIQKKVLDGKGTLRFAVSDIFYTNKNPGRINNLQLTEATWLNKGDSRTAALTFTYSFGKAFQPKDQHDATGADDEKNRVKS